MKVSNMNQQLQSLKSKAKECIRCIYADCYFIPLWELSKHDREIDEISDIDELLYPFHDFWERLPEDQCIRRYPFELVCQLAEEYFWIDEE